MNYVDIPLDFVGDLVLKTPWLGDAFQKSVKGVLSVANDTAQYTVRSRAIIAEFSAAGHQVSTLQDIRSLDLEDVDTMVDRKSTSLNSSHECAYRMPSSA